MKFENELENEEAGSVAALTGFKRTEPVRPAPLNKHTRRNLPTGTRVLANRHMSARPDENRDQMVAPVQASRCGTPAKQSGSLTTLTELLASGQFGKIRWDEFIGSDVIDGPDGQTRLQDAELARLELALEIVSEMNIRQHVLRKAVRLVANQNSFDSAKEYLFKLSAWDGVKRVERFLPDYLGTSPNPYELAVGRYIWTAMVARILEPGCKADMVPVLVGKQGSLKSSLLRILSPRPDQWTNVCLTERPSDLARKLLGKIVVV